MAVPLAVIRLGALGPVKSTMMLDGCDVMGWWMG